MKPRLLVLAFQLSLGTVVLQGCSGQSRAGADAARFFQKQCDACTAVIARLDEDEVAAQTFQVRYRHSDGTERGAIVLFMRESATWTVAR
jgi:hypothetical protein